MKVLKKTPIKILAFLFIIGQTISCQKQKQSFNELKKSAEQGDAQAQYRLGYKYYYGEGTSVDKKKGFYWYKKSAEQGDAAAQFALGVLYELGAGRPVDIKKASYWYKKSAEQGNDTGMNDTGMWEVRRYVDEFGESTKKKYIRNSSYIKGVFSNIATQDSELNVRFLISSSSKISIILYEYAGNNPVKAYSSESYRVLVLDRDKKRLELRAVNYSDRLTLNSSDSRKLHKALLKGGSIKFKIYEIDNPTTEYEFTITNADGYDIAIKKLAE